MHRIFFSQINCSQSKSSYQRSDEDILLVKRSFEDNGNSSRHKSHFPHFFQNFDNLFFFFLKLSSFVPHFSPPGGRVAHTGRPWLCHIARGHLEIWITEVKYAVTDCCMTVQEKPLVMNLNYIGFNFFIKTLRWQLLYISEYRASWVTLCRSWNITCDPFCASIFPLHYIQSSRRYSFGLWQPHGADETLLRMSQWCFDCFLCRPSN